MPAVDPWEDPFAADELAGRVCLVTGAAQGIGARIAQTLAERGATVAVTDLNAEGAEACAARLREAGLRASSHPLDVRDAPQIDAVVSEVEAACGPLEVLVNNAGLCIVEPSLDVSDANWSLQLDVMLSGPFKLARRAAQGMLARERGAIVNVCSIGGFGAWPQRAAYNTAKAGVKALTELLAVEWATRGVRVNGIAPAVTRTEILSAVLEEAGGRITLGDYEGRTPMGRVAEAQEMADGVLFLASDLSAYITGHTLVIDGGWLAADGFPTRREDLDE
jgi:NAD(P)-dependent dehydrogenase (short-subunit alcohol dehydrogenase family)